MVSCSKLRAGAAARARVRGGELLGSHDKDEPDCGNFIHVSYVNMPLWPSRLVRLGSSAKQHSDPGMLVIVQRTLHMQLHIQCCVMHNAYYFMLFLYAVVLGQK